MERPQREPITENNRIDTDAIRQSTIDGMVSVITPLYNAKDYIKGAIQSVQEQSYTNWEMVIIDDGSTDDSIAIVEEIQKKDERIRLIFNDGNQGVASARNHGIRVAKGRYIAFLDSDDLWLPDKLEIQLEQMKHKQCGFCYGNCQVIDHDGRVYGKERIAPAKITYRQLLYGNPIPCVTVVLDRWSVGQIQMPRIGHEDYATWLMILQYETHYAIGVEKIVAQYREDKKSLSGNKWKAVRWQWDIYRKFLKMGCFQSLWYYMNYVIRAVKKRL